MMSSVVFCCEIELTSYLCVHKQNFAAQYDGVKAPDPGPGPMVRMFCWCFFELPPPVLHFLLLTDFTLLCRA